MKKLAIATAALVLSGCMSTPESVNFNGETVGTYSVAASCSDMLLDTDCSGMTGATKDIELAGIKLRAAAGQSGKVVFIMSESSFSTDQTALQNGAKSLEKLFKDNGIQIESKKVMFGGGDVYGVHFQLSGNGYRLLKSL